MNRKISVVTGANGFVGSHIVDYLLEQGHHVKCIVRKTSNLRWLKGKEVEIIDCGLSDKNQLKNVLKQVDFLFHIAGVVKSKKKEGYFKGNVETTKNLLEVVSEINPNISRIIITSSLTASGPSLNNNPRTEDMQDHPITTYGKSKLEQEKIAKAYMNRLPITIVRPPAIYGERDTEIYLFFKTFQKGLMTLIGFNKKQLSIIHVSDLVRGIYKAAISEKANGKTYFISSEKLYDWDQIGNITESALGKKAVRIKIPHAIVYAIAGVAQFFALFSSKAATFNLEKARDFVQPAWTCSPKKAMEDFGFHQEVSLSDGIKRTINWYRENNWL